MPIYNNLSEGNGAMFFTLRLDCMAAAGRRRRSNDKTKRCGIEITPNHLGLNQLTERRVGPEKAAKKAGKRIFRCLRICLTRVAQGENRQIKPKAPTSDA
jgi:hypothetical protein